MLDIYSYKILIFTHNLYMAVLLVYIHELGARARQLMAYVAQLVRALHRNRRAAGSIPAWDLKLHSSLLFLVRSNKCI